MTSAARSRSRSRNIAPLRSLELQGNAFTGTIPPDLAKLTNLTDLDLSGNTLTGAIPHQLGSLANLEVLSLYDNQLSGAIPAELGQLTKLRLPFPRWQSADRHDPRRAAQSDEARPVQRERQSAHGHDSAVDRRVDGAPRGSYR